MDYVEPAWWREPPEDRRSSRELAECRERAESRIEDMIENGEFDALDEDQAYELVERVCCDEDVSDEDTERVEGDFFETDWPLIEEARRKAKEA